jgi:hypothetical protein
MPLSPPQLTAAITVGLISGGMLGVATPKLAAGLAQGICLWLPQMVVTTIDTGAIGAGVGVAPFAVPPAILIPALIAGYAANGQLGPMAPLEALGLANGLAFGFAQGLMVTVHAGCGSGVGLARLIGPPAFPSLVAGLASVAMVGPGAASKANAISTAFVVVFNLFSAPIPIAGAPGPSPGGGAGIGVVV